MGWRLATFTERDVEQLKSSCGYNVNGVSAVFDISPVLVTHIFP